MPTTISTPPAVTSKIAGRYRNTSPVFTACVITDVTPPPEFPPVVFVVVLPVRSVVPSFGASYIFTVCTSMLSVTVKITVSATSYPSGAVTSVRVYVPAARFILCGSSVEIHDSISFPS